MADELYRYLNFDQIALFRDSADQVTIPAVNVVEVNKPKSGDDLSALA